MGDDVVIIAEVGKKNPKYFSESDSGVSVSIVSYNEDVSLRGRYSFSAVLLGIETTSDTVSGDTLVKVDTVGARVRTHRIAIGEKDVKIAVTI